MIHKLEIIIKSASFIKHFASLTGNRQPAVYEAEWPWVFIWKLCTWVIIFLKQPSSDNQYSSDLNEVSGRNTKNKEVRMW